MKNKNVNIGMNISIIQELVKVLDGWQIEETAKEVGFVQRNDGKLTPKTFIKALTFGIWDLANATLKQIAGKCEELQEGLKIKRQAIPDRLKKGVKLLEETLKQAMYYAVENSVSTDAIEVLKQFKNVYLWDCTLISVADKLVKIFRGLGGKNAKAALKLLVGYNILEKSFKEIEIKEAPGNDSGYTSEIVDNLEKGELAIFDLGFFNKKAFKDIIDKGAYFISRIKANTVLYKGSIEDRKTRKRIDLAKVLKKTGNVLDIDVYMNVKGEGSIPVRVVGVRLPEEVANRKRREANEEAKRKGETLSDEKSELLGWFIVITNVSPDMLRPETICEIYRIRWQIEIVFKAWKSSIGLDKVGEAGEDQLRCVLYGRLIVITLMTTIYSNCYHIVFTELKREVSILQFFDGIKTKIASVITNLKLKRYCIETLAKLFIHIAENSLYDSRKKRKSTTENLRAHSLPEVYHPEVG